MSVGRNVSDRAGARGGSRRLAALLLLALVPSLQAQSPVQAELWIPPSPTHVIGDPLPLNWRFKNTASEPLAFMWEGCCRLNGRLSVKAASLPIEITPPGQALAHMFAKAERLDPGMSRDFETLLSDWVTLRRSGAYELQGAYTGVLPSQQPQVPRGLGLWRDQATTAPMQVALLSVDDYLRQQLEREQQRGLHVRLSGPRRIDPLEPIRFRLDLTNLQSSELRLHWPDAFAFWWVDAEGLRHRTSPTRVEAAAQELVLAAGTGISQEFNLTVDQFESEPLGAYRCFVDLREEGPMQPRLPSNALSVDWRFDERDIANLLDRAAMGAKAGLRNAPLRLLRIYLADLSPALQSMRPEAVSSNALPLLRQLQLAGCLKSWGPKPGRVEIRIGVASDGNATLLDEPVRQCLSGRTNDAQEQLRRLLDLRRHLGWETAICLEPQPHARMRDVMRLPAMLATSTPDLSGLMSARFADPAETGGTRVSLQTSLIPAQGVVRLTMGDGRVRRSALLPDLTAEPTKAAQRFTPTDIARLSLAEVDDDALTQLAAQAKRASLQVLVIAAPELPWGELARGVRPLLAQQLAFDLATDQASLAP